MVRPLSREGRLVAGVGRTGLGKTVADLTMLRRMREAAAVPTPGASALVSTVPSGNNPGRLRMVSLVPPGLPRGAAALVVVLHGCTQDAAGYDAGSGWSTLARRHGFALLYPEQTNANNGNGCFNWFQPEDVTRGRGEVASIAAMIGETVATHGLDPARVYITGLSAGGAMTAAMLATYPELFAGGAIVAGLPFGAATTLSAAFDAMRNLRPRGAAAWGDLVRQASPHAGARPPVQVWHGSADTVVSPHAAEETVKQWADVLGVEAAPVTETARGLTRRRWTVGGRVALEAFAMPGVGHGIPLALRSEDLDESVGAAGPYMIDAGIGSTRWIAASWGLLTQAARTRAGTGGRAFGWSGGSGFGELIGGALRASGLKI